MDEKTTCQYCNTTSFREDMDCMGACGDGVFCPTCGNEVGLDGTPHVCDPENKECLRVKEFLGQEDDKFKEMVWNQKAALIHARNGPDDV